MRSTNSPIFFDDYHKWLGAKIAAGAADPLRAADCKSDAIADGAVSPKGGTIRKGTVHLSTADTTSLSVALSGAIKGQLAAQLQGHANVSAGIQSAVSKTVTGDYEYEVSTYTMDDKEFSQRVRDCKGQKDGANVIFSLTAIQLTGTGLTKFKRDLSANLDAIAGIDAVIGGAEAGVGAKMETVSDQAVDEKLSTQPFILFVGFHPEVHPELQ
jgi:hypothetical protein